MMIDERGAAPKFDLTAELPEIRPFPQTASRILAACDDPNVTANQLCEVAKCDPGVSLKILRVANSSTYGCSGEVRSLQHAVVVLGFKAIRTLAISVAAADTFQSGEEAKQQRLDLWNHSMGCGCVASILARYCPDVKPEEAFLAGIVHDAGKLVLLDTAACEYKQLAEENDMCSIIEAEQQMFGVDHQALGLNCADAWGLPLEVADAIGDHHNVLTVEIDSPIAKLVAAANVLAQKWGIGSATTLANVDIAPLLDSVTPDITDELLLEITAESSQQFREMQQAFGG